jgi:hypothetical protein
MQIEKSHNVREARKLDNEPQFGELAVFDEIYRSNYWGTGSGTGSSPEATAEYRRFIEHFMKDHSVRSVVDLGCGDWQFSSLIDWAGIRYRGFDAANSVVLANRERYAKENISFETLSDYKSLPNADLLLVKDVLQHLSNLEVAKIIEEVFPKYALVLVTNCVPPISSTFHRAGLFNRDIEIGDFRFLDIRLPPFNQTASLALDWNINYKGPINTIAYLYRRRRPGESMLNHFVKLPFRIIKWLAFGIDCEWRKQTLLIKK